MASNTRTALVAATARGLNVIRRATQPRENLGTQALIGFVLYGISFAAAILALGSGTWSVIAGASASGAVAGMGMLAYRWVRGRAKHPVEQLLLARTAALRYLSEMGASREELKNFADETAREALALSRAVDPSAKDRLGLPAPSVAAAPVK